MNNAGEEDPVLSIMLGTAGHVDHGKTALVRNLTGYNTDRHPEERSRGVSIDFAVAPFPLPDGRLAGVIDVPGHEDFIRNMVAGASAIDLLLLIVAADDSVMPQTEEHMRIAKALGISAVIGVITKMDLVTPELLEVVDSDVRNFLSRAGFPESPVHRVSNVSLQGIEALRLEITKTVSRLSVPPDLRCFRMPIRQVFSAKGHGIIVTGVPVSGQLRIDDPVTILPPGIPSTVRAIQNYRRQQQAAEAHRSTALNLRVAGGAETITRGMVLAAPDAYHATSSVIAWFGNHSGREILPLRHSVLFHSGTLSCLAKCRLLDCSEIAPMGNGFFRLAFDRPICLAAGDRFVLRNVANSVTYGGGRILAVHLSKPRRMTEAFFDLLIEAKEAIERHEYFVSELLIGAKFSFTTDELRERAQLPSEAFQSELQRLVGGKTLSDLGDGGWLVTSRIPELHIMLSRALRNYHRQNRATWGMKPSFVCELLKLPAECFRKLEPILLQSSELQMKHGRLALTTFEPQITAREIRLREEALGIIEQVGIQSIARGNLIEQLKASEKELRTVLKLLIDEGLVVQHGNNYFSKMQIDRCREALFELFRTHSVVEMAAFREAVGASRNAATLILDAFDAEGLTKRNEQGRTLLRKK